MWVLDYEGGAVNLSKAIYLHQSKGIVKAYFSTCGEAYLDEDDNVTHYYPESSILKNFKKEEDAKKYIAELVEKLNAEGN